MEMKLRAALLVLAVGLIAIVQLFGQTFGEITGLVTDSSGGVAANTLVTVTNPQTNFTRTANTNTAGLYTFPNLLPGVYNVKVEIQEFQAEVRTNVELQVEQAARIDFQLRVGAVTQTVEVSGGAPLLDTENAAVGTVIEN